MNEKKRATYVEMILTRLNGELFCPPPEQVDRMASWPIHKIRRYVERHYPRTSARILLKPPKEMTVDGFVEHLTQKTEAR